MRSDSNFLNLIKAMRIERSLFPLSFIMIAVASANKITIDILALGLCCILIYVSGGILNAKIDKDYKIKNSIMIPLVIIIAILISLINKIVFLTVISWIILSILYNKYSRRVLFADSFFLSITHAALPVFSAAILLDLSLKYSTCLSIFAFSSFFLFVPMKNLNGVKEDIEKKYKTIMTSSTNGKTLTYILFNFYLIVMFLSYFIFNLGNKFLIVFSFILAIKIFTDYFIYNGKQVLTYKLGRLVILVFSFAFVLDQSTSINIILISSILILVYAIYLTGDTISQVKKGVLE